MANFAIADAANTSPLIRGSKSEAQRIAKVLSRGCTFYVSSVREKGDSTVYTELFRYTDGVLTHVKGKACKSKTASVPAEKPASPKVYDKDSSASGWNLVHTLEKLREENAGLTDDERQAASECFQTVHRISPASVKLLARLDSLAAGFSAKK